MIKVLLLGLAVAYFAPPFEYEVVVYGEVSYALTVSNPSLLKTTPP